MVDGGPELDHRIRQNFLKLWTEKRQLPVDAFLSDPLTANAAVILFDQFPRNMFRGHADAYSTDHLALAISKGAIAKGFDEQLQTDERKFLYMPFVHSEDLDDQNRALLLFTEINDEEQIGYAREVPRHHRALRPLPAPQRRTRSGLSPRRAGSGRCRSVLEKMRDWPRVVEPGIS